MVFPDFTTPRGLPLIGAVPGTQMPGFQIAYDMQSNMLDAALDDMEQAIQDGQAVESIDDLPVGAGAWPGRVLFVIEVGMLYVCDEVGGWYAFAGKVPYYFGSRADSAVGTGSTAQPWLTTTGTARGITMTDGVLTFQIVGVYDLNQTVIWEANSSGQRNLGIEGTGVSILGAAETDVHPSGFVEESHLHITKFAVLEPGATLTPYVTHNTGVALDVKGNIDVMWRSA